MPIYYADSSVLVKRHVLENGSQWVRDLFDRSSENGVHPLRAYDSIRLASALTARAMERNKYANFLAAGILLATSAAVFRFDP